MTSFITLHNDITYPNCPQILGKKICISVEKIVFFISNGERRNKDFKTKYEKDLPPNALGDEGTKLELSTGSIINVCECEEYIRTVLNDFGYSIE